MTHTPRPPLSIILGLALCSCWWIPPARAQDGAEVPGAAPADADALATENVFLITTDGLRWREVFGGADRTLIDDARFVRPAHAEEVAGRFWRDTPEARRRALMPFFWGVIADKGQLYGDRAAGSNADTTNKMWFSYPGYNEILTGLADDEHVDSNDPIPNDNVTVLEFVNRAPGFEGEVAAFGDWSVYSAIINEQRSGVPVETGTHADMVTQKRALEYLDEHTPRLLYVAFDWTDTDAHAGDYEAYLDAAHDVDGFVEELWEYAQSHEQYKGKTTLIITTDHGRGEGDKWTSHGASVAHAGEIWIAVLGPDTPALGDNTPGQVSQNQIARTVATLLGVDYRGEPGTGEPIKAAIGR